MYNFATMGKRDYYRHLTVAKGYKKALILFSVIEILLGLASIGLTIPAIVLARQNYIDCYNSLVGGTAASCNLYGRLNTYTLTSQGIWEGVLIIISAAITIDFTKVSSWKTYSYMNGFSTLANVLSGTMIMFEAFTVSDYIAGGYVGRYASDYPLWCLHVTLLSLACVIWLVTTAKKVTVSRVWVWGKVAASDAEAPTQPPPPATYTVSG